MAEIQKADPRLRRTGLVVVGAAAILGVLLMSIAASLRPDFEAWVRQDLTVRVRMVMIALTLLTAGPALGMAGYLWHLGHRIIRAERYPPPGLRVVRDTLVVSGQAAGRRGRLMQGFGAVIGLASLLLAFFLVRLLALLE
jgi:hypothetical protein